MASDWPSGLDQFGEFLRSQGLSFERRGIVPHTVDKLWQFGTSKIGVRVVADRGVVWSIRVADIAGWPQQWYAASELRGLLTGNDEEWPSEPDDGIAAQRKFVEEQMTDPDAESLWLFFGPLNAVIYGAVGFTLRLFFMGDDENSATPKKDNSDRPLGL